MKNRLLNIIILFISIGFIYAENSSKLTDSGSSINCTGNCYEPIANAGENRIYYNGSTIMLDGSDSYDPDDLDGMLSLTYEWSGPINFDDNTLPRPSFTSPLVFDGVLNCSDTEHLTQEDCLDDNAIWSTATSSLIPISLIVNDGEYNSNVDVIIITLLSINSAPTLTIDQNYEVNKNSNLTLDASMASDDNSLTGSLVFTWDYPDFTFVNNICFDDDGNEITDVPSNSCITL